MATPDRPQASKVTTINLNALVVGLLQSVHHGANIVLRWLPQGTEAANGAGVPLRQAIHSRKRAMTKHANHIDFIEFPALSAESITSAKAFYAETFGWKFKDWGTDYADTESSGVGSGFNADLSHRPNQPLAVIYAPALEQTMAKVVAAGGTITKDVFSFPGGRRFHFIDPAGNELAAWSDV